MTQDALRFIVVGAGLIGPRHAQHILKRDDCVLFAIVDRLEKGPGVAAKLNTLHFRNLDEMFDFCSTYKVPGPDAAIVATPNHTHTELGVRLAARGVHLLIEKPMASSVEDCRSLLRFCNHHRVQLLIGHHRRFNPYIAATKAHMQRIGQPVAVQGVWALKKHDAYFAEKAWRRSVRNGGGTILINLIHDLDLLQYLLGPVRRVYAELLPRQRLAEGPDDHVDEGAVLTLRFANGCCGTFVCSDNVTSPFSFESGTGENPLIPHNSDAAGFYRIFGSDGTLLVPDLTLFHQNGLRDKSWWEPVHAEKLPLVLEKHVESNGIITPPSSYESENVPMVDCQEPIPEPFDLQLEHFVNLITGVETTVKCSGEDAIQAMLCIEAVLKSIETGLPQTVEVPV